MKSLFRRCLPVIAAAITATPAFSADAVCQLIAQANAKIYAVSTHIFSTETAAYSGGKTRSNELIYLNNKSYLQINGKWRLSRSTPAQMAALQKEAQNDNAGMTCKMVRDEAVNGEAATLYAAHKQTPDVKEDSQIWISKSKGMPIKLEMDLDVGGAAGKSHRSMRYEYTNVQAPAGVQ